MNIHNNFNYIARFSRNGGNIIYIYYVTNTGTIIGHTPVTSMAIRPLIALKQEVEFVSGNGSKNNPYIVAN